MTSWSTWRSRSFSFASKERSLPCSILGPTPNSAKCLLKFSKELPEDELLAALSTEQRLKGLPAEERLKGLPAEERLKGLPAEERLKGLKAEDCVHGMTPEELERLRKLLEAKPRNGANDQSHPFAKDEEHRPQNAQAGPHVVPFDRFAK